MTTQIPTNPVAYIELHTNDPARARAFYGELLGWKSEEELTPAGPYWMFQGVLAGFTAPRDGLPPGWIPYIKVDSITAATSRARALGAEVLRDCIAIDPGTFSVIHDPAGGVVGLWEAAK